MIDPEVACKSPRATPAHGVSTQTPKPLFKIDLDEEGSGAGEDEGGGPDGVEVEPCFAKDFDTEFFIDEEGDEGGDGEVGGGVEEGGVEGGGSGGGGQSVSVGGHVGHLMGGMSGCGGGEENGNNHESGTVDGGDEERPESEVARVDAHGGPAEMRVANEEAEAGGDENRGDEPADVVERERGAEKNGDEDGSGDGQGVSDGERDERAKDGDAFVFLEGEGDGEEPAHGGVEAMKGAEEEKGENGVGVRHGGNEELCDDGRCGFDLRGNVSNALVGLHTGTVLVSVRGDDQLIGMGIAD